MQNSFADWTLITVTYNNARELDEWWTSVDLADARWIVVDNNSTDHTATLAESLGAEVIRLPKNVGFSRANNAGLRQATSKFVAFVNPDVMVDTGSLAAIGKLIDQTGAIVCPQLINPDGSLQPNGRGLPYLADKLAHRGFALPGSSRADYLLTSEIAPVRVAWAMGAAVCTETAVIRRAGAWDERYFLYYEDHALGLAAWLRGQEVLVTPSARWVHAWKRETKRFRLRPWAHEIASACRFYARFPELLALPTPNRRRNWRGLGHKIGVELRQMSIGPDVLDDGVAR